MHRDLTHPRHPSDLCASAAPAPVACQGAIPAQLACGRARPSGRRPGGARGRGPLPRRPSDLQDDDEAHASASPVTCCGLTCSWPGHWMAGTEVGQLGSTAPWTGATPHDQDALCRGPAVATSKLPPGFWAEAVPAHGAIRVVPHRHALPPRRAPSAGGAPRAQPTCAARTTRSDFCLEPCHSQAACSMFHCCSPVTVPAAGRRTLSRGANPAVIWTVWGTAGSFAPIDRVSCPSCCPEGCCRPDPGPEGHCGRAPVRPALPGSPTLTGLPLPAREIRLLLFRPLGIPGGLQAAPSRCLGRGGGRGPVAALKGPQQRAFDRLLL
jgi:hypothetical protein